MTREIKFRAWDKQDKRMIIDRQDFIPLIVTSAGVFRLSATHKESLYHLCDPDRFELMQYTGLTDKNGVEIYEGDIMRHDQFWDGHDCDVVEWSNEDAAYSFLGCASEWRFHCEVVGNIYENPELLTD